MSLFQRLNKESSFEEPGGSSKPKDTKTNQTNHNKPKTNKDKQEDPYENIKKNIKSKIIEDIKENKIGKVNENGDDNLEEEIKNIIDIMLDKETSYIPKIEKSKIISQILDETIGFGPINQLILDESVSEIMVNGPNKIFVERNGRLELSDVKFKDNQHVMHVIDKIVSPIGRRIDESSPIVDARLPDGSRVNIIIPPLALDGPSITIRKFSETPYTAQDLINFGTITPEVAAFLKACIAARLNIVVSGGTGSGKTTTLNMISSFISSDERIVTIEDAAELQMMQEHVLRLETRPPNIEGKGSVTIRDLVRNSLRMRPDRIVVGEVRSGEALDMLQAMNTGHDGSLTTGHANTPRDMIARLETMVLMSGMDLPIKAIREQIASAVDLIIQQSRLKDGSRKITHVTEITGMEGDTITLQDIFLFEKKGVGVGGKILGNVEPTGIKPSFMEKLLSSGVSLPNDIFTRK